LRLRGEPLGLAKVPAKFPQKLNEEIGQGKRLLEGAAGQRCCLLPAPPAEQAAVESVNRHLPIHWMNGKNMRGLAGTATLIASIAIAIVLLFMVPKGFEIAPPEPVVSSNSGKLP
jgi:hypothetical protein